MIVYSYSNFDDLETKCIVGLATNVGIVMFDPVLSAKLFIYHVWLNGFKLTFKVHYYTSPEICLYESNTLD